MRDEDKSFCLKENARPWEEVFVTGYYISPTMETVSVELTRDQDRDEALVCMTVQCRHSNDGSVLSVLSEQLLSLRQFHAR